MGNNDKGLRRTFDAQITVTKLSSAIVRKAFWPETIAVPDGKLLALVTATRRMALSEPYVNDWGIRQQNVIDASFIEEGETFRLEPEPESPFMSVRVFGQVRER